MLCGNFAVIAVPSVLGFAPVVLKCRSIDGLNLLFKAVDVGAEFCGELNLALFGAGGCRYCGDVAMSCCEDDFICCVITS